jgi:hypothetical protein
MKRARQSQDMKHLIDEILNGSQRASFPLNSHHTGEEVVNFFIDAKLAHFEKEMQTLRRELIYGLPEGPLDKTEFIQAVLSTNRAVNSDMKAINSKPKQNRERKKQRKTRVQTKRHGPEPTPSGSTGTIERKTTESGAGTTTQKTTALSAKQGNSTFKLAVQSPKETTIDVKQAIHDDWLGKLSAKRGSGVAEERSNTSQLSYKVNELLQLRDVQMSEISSNGTEQLLLGKIDEICAVKASSELPRSDQKKLQGWRIHMLLNSGQSTIQVANLMKLDESTIKRSHSIYQAITELGKLRYYTGNMDELRKVVSLLQKEAKRTGQVDKWNLNEHPETFMVNGVKMLSIKYLLGMNFE